jgi:hypothetical protein
MDLVSEPKSLTLSFADLAGLAIHLVGHGAYTHQQSVESWALDVQDYHLSLEVYHHTDIWVIRSSDWLIHFRYEPYLNQDHPDRYAEEAGEHVNFGSLGIAQALIYQGDADAIQRDMTMFKMLLPPYKEIPHTHGVFLFNDVLP